MNNIHYVSTASFEKEKNLKAGLITTGVMAAFLLWAFLYNWGLPALFVPIPQDGIEVNLGNSETGLGDIQPLIPGEPSSDDNTAYNPPTPSEANEEVKDVDTDDSDADAPPVIKPNTPPSRPTNNIPNRPVNPVVNNNPGPAVNPTPAPPKPKATYKGGNNSGPGGNNADTWNGSRNNGIAGGPGDQGQPGGNPNSGNFNGRPGPGTGGISIRRGLDNRRIASAPSFQDEFAENGKVAVDITINAAGQVIRASFQPVGSTTTNATMKSIALRRAREVKFNPGAEEQSGTIVFNFKIRS